MIGKIIIFSIVSAIVLTTVFSSFMMGYIIGYNSKKKKGKTIWQIKDK